MNDTEITLGLQMRLANQLDQWGGRNIGEDLLTDSGGYYYVLMQGKDKGIMHVYLPSHCQKNKGYPPEDYYI